MDFTEKVALITGAASGMGAATAREYRAAGGQVVIVDLNDQLAAWTQGQDAKQLMAQLQTAGIPAAVLNSPLDLIDDPQLADRNYIQWLHHEHVGNLRHPSAPYRSGTEPFPVRTPAPTLGQHNQDVLMGLLGLNEAEVAALKERGIIGTRPRMPQSSTSG